MKRVLLVVVGLVAAGCLLAGAAMGDRVTTQPEEQAAPPFEDPVAVEGLSAEDATVADPGAVVEVEPSGPAIEGLPGGAWIVPEELAAEDPVATPAAIAATAETLGAVSLAPPLQVTRFVDLCTTGANPCPLGIAATVKPHAGDLPPAKLEIKLFLGLTKVAAPKLRCDPGYRTSQALPVVITANAPLFEIDVQLDLVDLAQLDRMTVHQASSEKTLYEQRIASGTQLGTDIANGLHYCASLRTEGDPLNAAKIAGAALPVSPTYRVTALATALATGSAAATAEQPALTPGARPPTLVVPVTGHVAQVVVSYPGPQQPSVWVNYGWKECGTPGTQPPPAAQTYDPGQLAAVNYPYDPVFDHYSVWNLVLRESAHYILCIQRPGAELETWKLETPDGKIFLLRFDEFTEVGYTSALWSLSIPDAGCYRVIYDSTDVLGQPPVNKQSDCESDGYPWPAVTDVKLTRSPKGKNVTEDMGHKRLLTPTWCAFGPPVMAGVAPAAEGGWLEGMCVDVKWPTTFEYRDQNILCGSDCGEKGLRAVLKARATISEGWSNGRRDPLAWVIEGPPGERGISLPSGPTGPGLSDQ